VSGLRPRDTLSRDAGWYQETETPGITGKAPAGLPGEPTTRENGMNRVAMRVTRRRLSIRFPPTPGGKREVQRGTEGLPAGI